VTESKNGFEVVVFESEQSLDARSRDWTILLHWAMPAFDNLLPEDIKNNISEAICNPYLDFNTEVECLPCYNGITGELLFKSPLPGSRRVSRQRLRKVLANGLDIRWGTKLTQMNFSSSGSENDSGRESQVNLVFDGGKKDRSDYVFAADGASSKVRELLLGPDAARAQHSGFMFATGIAKYHDAGKVEAVVKAHPVAAITLGMEVVAGCGSMYICYCFFHGQSSSTFDFRF
jgi:flavin-dependent dehydrogenase